MAYLFAHFKEKYTPDGEQVYFAVSKNGFDWQSVNGGEPVVTCDSSEGEIGCRDIEIARLKSGGFVIIATDLCVANKYDENHKLDWGEIASNGSKCINVWFTDDLMHFSKRKLCFLGRDDFGCIWAPEIFFDEESGEYIVHFTACEKSDGYWHMAIYYCKTKDFKSFSYPQKFFEKENDVIDSHLVKIDGKYHLFYKNSAEPLMNMHAVSDSLFGEYRHDSALENYMKTLYRPGSYEAATTYVLPDGRWCLMLDFFGCEKDKMGYVGFISPKAGNADFKYAKESFSFPYGFKHGGVIEISGDEYDALINHKF